MKTRLLASLLALLLAIAPALADQSTLSSPTTGTVSGLQLTNNYNGALNALNTCNSGAAAPTNQLSGVPSKGNCWLDTSTTPNTFKYYDGANWTVFGYLDATNHYFIPLAGAGPVNTVASGATTDLCSSAATYLSVSGVTTITSFGSNCITGQVKVVTFTGALTLTHNGTSLILPNNSTNIATTAGDALVAVYLGSGNWKVPVYQKTSGQALQNPQTTVTTHGDSDYTIQTTDQNVVTSAALTLARTWTLPGASAFGAGTKLSICDEANGVTATNTLTVARAGADTIVLQGTTVNSYILTNAGACTSLFSDGTSKWLVYAQRMVSQYSTFTSGTGATYNTPSGATSLKVRMVGGGGGGSNTGADGGSGGTTSFGSWTAIGGGGTRTCTVSGTGGANGTGVQIVRMTGAGGNQANISLASAPGTLTGPRSPGASSPFGGGGLPSTQAYGSGGASNAPQNGQNFCSGGAGEYAEFVVPNPAPSYVYTVGGGGTAASGAVAGAAGVIIIEAVFN